MDKNKKKQLDSEVSAELLAVYLSQIQESIVSMQKSSTAGNTVNLIGILIGLMNMAALISFLLNYYLKG